VAWSSGIRRASPQTNLVNENRQQQGYMPNKAVVLTFFFFLHVTIAENRRKAKGLFDLSLPVGPKIPHCYKQRSAFCCDFGFAVLNMYL